MFQTSCSSFHTEFNLPNSIWRLLGSQLKSEIKFGELDRKSLAATHEFCNDPTDRQLLLFIAEVFSVELVVVVRGSGGAFSGLIRLSFPRTIKHFCAVNFAAPSRRRRRLLLLGFVFIISADSISHCRRTDGVALGVPVSLAMLAGL